jgi:hypothetical protein
MGGVLLSYQIAKFRRLAKLGEFFNRNTELTNNFEEQRRANLFPTMDGYGYSPTVWMIPTLMTA